MPSYGGKKFHPKKAADGTSEPVVRKWPKVINEIKYDSPLEFYTAELLREQRIPFEFKRKYAMFPSFNYCGETVIGLTLTVDFYLTDHDIILDPKGLQNDGNPIKWKLLKLWLLNKKQTPRICFVYNQQEARDFVMMVKYGFSQKLKEPQVNGRITKLKKLSKMIGSEFMGGKTGEVVCTLENLKTMADYDFDKLLKTLKQWQDIRLQGK